MPGPSSDCSIQLESSLVDYALLNLPQVVSEVASKQKDHSTELDKQKVILAQSKVRTFMQYEATQSFQFRFSV